MEWTETDPPPQAVAYWKKARWPKEAWPRRFVTRSGLNALIGIEHWPGDPPDVRRWHLSVSGPDRLPTWDELVDAAHTLRPGVPFTMGVPPRSWWMNVHPHVLHLWESRDAPLIQQWRFNAQAAGRRGPTPPT